MPVSHTSVRPEVAQQFREDLLHFINAVLPKFDRDVPQTPGVHGSTPLFESGLIDSLAILHLIAFVERTTGKKIPPRMVVMKHFRTVDAICESFGPTEGGG
jgi:acyl carrier protein